MNPLRKGALWSGPEPAASWDHPWRPHQQLKGVAFTVALIQSLAGDGPLEPTIKVNGEQVPLSGNTGRTKPVLTLDPADAKLTDGGGVSFAVLEVEPDDQGELRKDSRIEIVHSLNVTSKTADIGRKAILQILWKSKQVLRIRSCVHFNLVYQRVLPPAGQGFPRHYFT